MRALTISQPHASNIISGLKIVENRVWSTRYRGDLAIHAGKGTQYLTRGELKQYPHGCFLGVVELCCCHSLAALTHMHPGLEIVEPGSGITVGQILAHDHTEGPECWILRRVRLLKAPIPYRGGLGLWTIPPRILTQIRAALT